MMAAGCRDDERVDRLLLSTDVRQVVDGRLTVPVSALVDGKRDFGHRLIVAVDVEPMPTRHTGEGAAPDDADPVDESGLRTTRLGHDDRTASRPGSGDDGGQDARHGTKPPVEPQLADVDGVDQ